MVIAGWWIEVHEISCYPRAEEWWLAQGKESQQGWGMVRGGEACCWASVGREEVSVKIISGIKTKSRR